MRKPKRKGAAVMRHFRRRRARRVKYNARAVYIAQQQEK